MEDEAEKYEGIRAQFPVSFGKQSKSQTSLEALHNTTLRAPSSSSSSSFSSSAVQDFPSLSSSSKTWLNSLRKPKPSDPDFAVDDESGSGSAMVGPPRTGPGLDSADDDDDDDGGGMIGPPRPPPASDLAEDDDGGMIGPPRPPPASDSANDDDDGGVMMLSSQSQRAMEQ